MKIVAEYYARRRRMKFVRFDGESVVFANDYSRQAEHHVPSREVAAGVACHLKLGGFMYVTDNEICVPVDTTRSGSFGVPMRLMRDAAELFGTEDVNLEGEHEGRLSDVTPGAGLEVRMVIRGYRTPSLQDLRDQIMRDRTEIGETSPEDSASFDRAEMSILLDCEDYVGAARLLAQRPDVREWMQAVFVNADDKGSR